MKIISYYSICENHNGKLNETGIFFSGEEQASQYAEKENKRLGRKMYFTKKVVKSCFSSVEECDVAVNGKCL